MRSWFELGKSWFSWNISVCHHEDFLHLYLYLLCQILDVLPVLVLVLKFETGRCLHFSG
jgi:hypothetical protein